MILKKKIVIYGGSFNPPHPGHADTIKAILRFFPCDEIWIMPSSERSDKKIKISGKHRVQMLRLMIKKMFPRPEMPIKISAMELERPKLTTTLETKLELEQKYPDYQFYFLIGSELVKDIETRWVHGKELYRSANFLVLLRKHAPLENNLPKNFVILSRDVVGSDLSSTFIRNLIAQEKSAAPYLMPEIAEYIKRHRLYQQI